MKNTENFFKLLQVYDIEGMTKHRIGNKNDGGYVISSFSEGDLFSIGIGNDTAFEQDWVNSYGNAYCFDHTIESIPKTNKVYFNQIGLGVTD